MKIKIKQTLINQKSNLAKVNYSNNSNSKQLLFKKT